MKFLIVLIGVFCLLRDGSAECQMDGLRFYCPMSDTPITSVPDDINPMTTHLDLSVKAIGSITKEDFEDLSNVERLSMSSNNIVSLEFGVFSNMPNLKFLDLERNLISYVDRKAFTGIQKLRTLDLTYNRIDRLDVDVFVEIPELVRLNLGHNKLTSLNPDIFQRLVDLEKLYLHNNPFGSLDAKLFNGLVNLQVLNLRKTRLAGVHVDLFVDLSSLGWLILADNDIEELSEEHLRNVPRPPLVLELYGNPLKCCQLLWLKTENTLGKIVWAAEGSTYGGPPECVDKPWDLLTAVLCPVLTVVDDLLGTDLTDLADDTLGLF